MFLITGGINSDRLSQYQEKDRANYKTVHVLVPWHRKYIPFYQVSGRYFEDAISFLFFINSVFSHYTFIVSFESLGYF